jgi:hypothetical protein
MITKKSIFAILNPTETLLERFQALHDDLEVKDNARLEVMMSLIANDQVHFIYGLEAQMFLDNWRRKPPQLLEGMNMEKGVSIALFRPYLISDICVGSTMPMSQTKRLAVLLKGVISNFSEIRAELSLYGCPHPIYKLDDIILYLLEHYLETGKMSPVEAVKKLMKRMEGHFVMMALIAEGEKLMVGSRDEPLIIGRDSQTVYFGTDFEVMEHFSESSISVIDKKTVLFCTTPYQSELPTPIIID